MAYSFVLAPSITLGEFIKRMQDDYDAKVRFTEGSAVGPRREIEGKGRYIEVPLPGNQRAWANLPRIDDDDPLLPNPLRALVDKLQVERSAFGIVEAHGFSVAASPDEA